MKTIFEPINPQSTFFVEKDESDKTLYFKSLINEHNSICHISFILTKEESLNLAKHILKLYSK